MDMTVFETGVIDIGKDTHASLLVEGREVFTKAMVFDLFREDGRDIVGIVLSNEFPFPVVGRVKVEDANSISL